MRFTKLSLVLLHLLYLAAPIPPALAASPELVLRPQVAAAVKAAQSDEARKKPQWALAKLAEADVLPDLTAQESYMVARVRVSVLAETEDYIPLARALQVLLDSPLLPANEKAPFENALIAAFSGAGEYAQLVQRMSSSIRAGSDPEMHTLLVTALYKMGDFKTAAEVQQAF